MIKINELKEAISEKFCNKRLFIEGFVELTESRGERILRRINDFRINPISYSDGTLIFFLIEGNVTIDKSKSIPINTRMVAITDEYENLARLIESFDEYDWLPLDLSFGSQEIYNRYFEQNADRPFQGYAFEFSLNLRINYSDLIEL